MWGEAQKLPELKVGSYDSHELYEFKDLVPKYCIFFFTWLYTLKDPPSPNVLCSHSMCFVRLRSLPMQLTYILKETVDSCQMIPQVAVSSNVRLS